MAHRQPYELTTKNDIVVACHILQIDNAARLGRGSPEFAVGNLSSITRIDYDAVYSIVKKFKKKGWLVNAKLHDDDTTRYRLTVGGKSFFESALPPIGKLVNETLNIRN